jgi:hypothetical protein
MGLVGYYRRFIKGFSKIGIPITSLQRIRKKCVWSPECEDRFQEPNYLFTNAHVLKIADRERIYRFVLMLARKD